MKYLPLFLFIEGSIVLCYAVQYIFRKMSLISYRGCTYCYISTNLYANFLLLIDKSKIALY